MPLVACLQHLPEPFLGFAGEALRRAGLDIDERDLGGGDPVPALDEVDGIVTFGGRQSARDADRIDFLRAEAGLLREAVAAGVPVFGVCLGAQMLARAHGAVVRRMPRRMLAWHEPALLPAAAADPVFSHWPAGARALHWHEDEFDLPPGGVETMHRGGPGVEAFRVGDSAWGVQFHPETDAEAYERWCVTAEPAELEEAGVTLDDLRAGGDAHMAEQERAALALFGAFGDIVLSASPSPTRAGT